MLILPFSLALADIFHWRVNDMSWMYMLVKHHVHSKEHWRMPFFSNTPKSREKLERAVQAGYQSLYFMDASQEASTHSSLHLCLFSAVRFNARYVNCFWESHRSSYGTSRFLKGTRKKKKMKPVSDDIGISTWEICSDESSTVWRELRKATAKPKQATVMWI